MADQPTPTEDVYRAEINRDPSILVMATAAVQLAVRANPTPEYVAAEVIKSVEPVIRAAAYAAGREAAAQAILDHAAGFGPDFGIRASTAAEIARGGR